MTMEQLIRRMIGAAILVIALVLAPSIAAAHSGHAHGPTTASATAQPVKAEAPVKASVSAAPAASRDAARAVTGVTHLPEAGGKPASCTGGCCSGMSCSACSALALDEAEAPPPPRRTTRLALGALDARSSRDPDGLIRPPRSFA